MRILLFQGIDGGLMHHEASMAESPSSSMFKVGPKASDTPKGLKTMGSCLAKIKSYHLGSSVGSF